MQRDPVNRRSMNNTKIFQRKIQTRKNLFDSNSILTWFGPHCISVDGSPSLISRQSTLKNQRIMTSFCTLTWQHEVFAIWEWEHQLIYLVTYQIFNSQSIFNFQLYSLIYKDNTKPKSKSIDFDLIILYIH